jgi:hypothetical protein
MMEPTTEADELGIEHERPSGRRHALRVISFVLWGAVIVTQVSALLGDPSALNIIVASAFVLLPCCQHRLFLLRWIGTTTAPRRQPHAWLHSAPSRSNRNYILPNCAAKCPPVPPAPSSSSRLARCHMPSDRRGDDFMIAQSAPSSNCSSASPATDFIAT